jgi:hypothetical protein
LSEDLHFGFNTKAMIKTVLQKIEKDTNGKVDWKLILLFIPVAYVSYLFHEFGHWSVGEVLGNSMTYSLNNVSPQSGQYSNPDQALWVTLGGPAFTVLLALMFLLVIRIYKVLWAYTFVFFQFFCRFFSLVFGVFSEQDEARASAIIGAGKYTIAITVVLLLFIMIWRGSQLLKLNFKSNWYFFTVAVICELMVIATSKFI